MISKQPVLGLADRGPVSQIIEQTKIGDVLQSSDVESIKAYLEKSLDKFKRCELIDLGPRKACRVAVMRTS
jgi:hypothetical protein